MSILLNVDTFVASLKRLFYHSLVLTTRRRQADAYAEIALDGVGMGITAHILANAMIYRLMLRKIFAEREVYAGFIRHEPAVGV